MGQGRPNILFLMSDEHRADVTGYEGNSVIRTPTLDRLAASGVTFRNAYTPSPICIPARQCMMAGQLPKTCNCQSFGEDLAPDSMTFARQFARYAYHATCSGKLHHVGTDQMQGWTKRIAPDANISERFIDGKIESEFARYEPAPGTGKWTNQREIEEARVAEGPYQTFDRRALDAALDYVDRYFADTLYRRPQSHRPLLFKLSLLQPHYPFFTSQRWFDYYHDIVPVYRDEPSSHPVLRRSQAQRGEPVSVSETDARRATASYYGMISTVDEYFERLLSRLEELGEDLDDWIIVYTSDHGDMLGEHGIWEKTKFYEASVRVPLIISWPRRFTGARVVEENVNLCDLFATLCELADIETPPGLDSRSLVPLLQGEACDWDNESVSQMGRHHLMIKQGNLKYQYYGEDVPEVLFDLERDPRELKNMIDAPEYAEQVIRFRERRGELGHGPDADANYRDAGYGGSKSARS